MTPIPFTFSHRLDPKPNHTTDRYQVFKPNGIIRVKAILPSSPNDSICNRLLAEPCSPRASIPCNWNIVFANSIHTIVLCIRVPLFVLTMRVVARSSTPIVPRVRLVREEGWVHFISKGPFQNVVSCLNPAISLLPQRSAKNSNHSRLDFPTPFAYSV